MIKKLFIILFIILVTSTAFALEPVDLNKYAEQVPDVYKNEKGEVPRHHVVKNAFGDWEQLVVTTSGTYHIIFHKVFDTWRRNYVGPQHQRIEVDSYKDLTIHVDLLEKMPRVEIINPKDRENMITLIFSNSFKWIPHRAHDGHFRRLIFIDCVRPLDPHKTYSVMKPKIIENYFRESVTYKKVVIDLSKDIFINKDTSLAAYERDKAKDVIQSLKPTPPHVIRAYTIDTNNNGIIDIYQPEEVDPVIYNKDGSVWSGPKFLKEHREKATHDINNDAIRDEMQTFNAYYFNENSNFIDVDGDSLCDNYSKGIYDSIQQQAIYANLTFDLRKDPFQNRQSLLDLGMGMYTDTNMDGIDDGFQTDKLTSHNTLAILFEDKNNDTISDFWQTLEGYRRLRLRNFIDLDGDGLCDNYLRN